MAINNPIVTDSDWLQDTALAIQEKDGGGKIEVPNFAGRIRAIPSGGTLIPKIITENGVYNASSDNADGYDVVTVDVPEENMLDKYFANTLEVADIPSATTLMRFMFLNKSNLVNVIMPNVTDIAVAAFQNCSRLALTSLPSGITVISSYTFQNCSRLALTNLPSGITIIDAYGFSGCSNLALTSLPSGITSIGTQAFAYCSSIPYLNFSEFTQIPTLEADAFLSTFFPFYFRDQQQLDEWAAATNWSTYANRFQIKPSGVI